MLYFGTFGFDVRTGRLTREGVDLGLRRTAGRVLAVLLEHRPRTVTQEEILQTVWPSQVVDRAAVKNYIKDLRAILGDDRRTPRFIASEDGGIDSSPPSRRARRRSATPGAAPSSGATRPSRCCAPTSRRRSVDYAASSS